MSRFGNARPEDVLKAHIRELTLERWEHSVQWRIQPELVRCHGILRAFDADDYVARLSAYVWGTSENEETHEHPTTWWDAVKARWFPKWALLRWPPSVTRITVRRGLIFPEFFPGGGPGVQADRMRVAVYSREEL